MTLTVRTADQALLIGQFEKMDYYFILDCTQLESCLSNLFICHDSSMVCFWNIWDSELLPSNEELKLTFIISEHQPGACYHAFMSMTFLFWISPLFLLRTPICCGRDVALIIKYHSMHNSKMCIIKNESFRTESGTSTDKKLGKFYEIEKLLPQCLWSLPAAETRLQFNYKQQNVFLLKYWSDTSLAQQTDWPCGARILSLVKLGLFPKHLAARCCGWKGHLCFCLPQTQSSLHVPLQWASSSCHHTNLWMSLPSKQIRTFSSMPQLAAPVAARCLQNRTFLGIWRFCGVFPGDRRKAKATGFCLKLQRRGDVFATFIKRNGHAY